jgi:hypothetical protein
MAKASGILTGIFYLQQRLTLIQIQFSKLILSYRYIFQLQRISIYTCQVLS